VSRLEVILVTATSANFPHTRIMQRLVDEAEYVLTVLYRIRDAVSANPKLFDPDAKGRIDEAITRTQAVLRSARSESSVEQKVKAA
jgi:hypothetical protein